MSRFHRILWAGRDPREPLRPTLKRVAPTGIKPCPRCCLHQALEWEQVDMWRDPAPLWCLLALRRITLHSLNAWYWKEEAQQWWWPSAKTNHPKNQKKVVFLTNPFLFLPCPPSSWAWTSGCRQPLIHGWCVGTAQLVTGGIQGFQAVLCSAQRFQDHHSGFDRGPEYFCDSVTRA